MPSLEELGKILNWSACRECGDCLARCRYLGLSREEAISEIKKINAGLPARAAERCVSCYACDAFCPNGAHPYERIHYRWNARYLEKGLPARASYLMPTRRPNFRQDIAYSAEEKRLHEAWGADSPPARTVLYPGCNLLTMPLLMHPVITDRLPVWGRWELCCGEMYFRMGLLDEVEKTAKRLTEYYAARPVDEMVFLCPAGYNMFTNVLPTQFGARFSFKTVPFAQWFLRELDRGAYRITDRLTGSVVIHDSCHARVLGDSFLGAQRAMLERLGLTVIETTDDRADGLCCGMAAGCTSYSGLDIMRCASRELKTLDGAGADEAAIYCTGCLIQLGIARLASPFGRPLRHVLELVYRAMGISVNARLASKSFRIFRGIAAHALPRYLDPRRFRL